MHKKSLSIIGAAALIILFLVGALPAIAQAQPEGTPYTECISDTIELRIINGTSPLPWQIGSVNTRT